MSQFQKINKNLKESSRRWLQRQWRDPFVTKAKQLGYRSRAAFKILEIQEKYKLFKSNHLVIDLGAAPGGWSHVMSKYVRKIIAIDLLDMDTIPNVSFIKGDFLTEDTIWEIDKFTKGSKIDIVMSDMAPSSCGLPKVDHLRIMNLVEHVFDFAINNLRNDGHMIAKVFQGGTEPLLLSELKKHFTKVAHFKPKSSRKESAETYLIALGFKG